MQRLPRNVRKVYRRAVRPFFFPNLVLLSKQQPSRPRVSPTEHDSNVFPAPIDSVTDSSMNPEIVTNVPDVRRRGMEEDQSKSSIVLFLACTEVPGQRLT
jgi:hypothetical protein